MRIPLNPTLPLTNSTPKQSSSNRSLVFIATEDIDMSFSFGGLTQLAVLRTYHGRIWGDHTWVLGFEPMELHGNALPIVLSLRTPRH